MGIKSHAFGGVVLTGADADKFVRQVKFGRPKAEAVTSLQRGIKMTEAMNASGGRFVVSLGKPRPARTKKG